MCEDCWAEVVLLLFVWVVEGGESWVGVIRDGAQVLLVGRVLSFAVEPDHLAHHFGILLGQSTGLVC